MNTSTHCFDGSGNVAVALRWGMPVPNSAGQVAPCGNDRAPCASIAHFALIHGAIAYRLRGILIFFAICLVVSNVVENLGVATGFPFGAHYFTDAMGPKLFQVPILMGFAYVGVGYFSWTLGRVILGNLRFSLVGARVFLLPLAAALIMVASISPMIRSGPPSIGYGYGSTVEHILACPRPIFLACIWCFTLSTSCSRFTYVAALAWRIHCLPVTGVGR